MTDRPRSKAAGNLAHSKAHRCLAIVGHVYIGWLCWLLAAATLALTAVYAVHPASFTTGGFHFLGNSIGRSILTLRLLSAATDIMLSITFGAALDRLQVLMVGMPDGAAFTRLLAVHPSTSYIGLAILGCGAGKRELTARAIAVGRLLVVILVPALGVIILSDVGTRLAFTHYQPYNLTNTEGMSFLNSTRAIFVSSEVDRIFSNSMINFLSNNELAVDITPEDKKSMSCAELTIKGKVPTCERVVFMPGNVPAGLLLDDSSPEADIQTVFNMKGYVLRYGAGDASDSWSFDEEVDCQTHGMEQGAVRLCLANPEPGVRNVIRARMISCPPSLAMQSGQCLTDTSWHLGTQETSNVSTMLTAGFRLADVAFHRANNSIAWHSFVDEAEEPASIAASDLLAVYANFTLGTGSMVQAMQEWTSTTTVDSASAVDTSADSTGDLLSSAIDGLVNVPDSDLQDISVLKSRTSKRQLAGLTNESGTGGFSGSITSLMGLPGSNPIFPVVPFMYLQTCSALAAQNARTATICTNFLQNFLAIPLYWCDNLLPIRAQGAGLDLTNGLLDSTSSSDDDAAAQIREFLAYLGIDDENKRRLATGAPGTEVALSRLRYEIVVGRGSLIAYVAIAVSILVLCFVILAAATGDLESPGYWPLWDSTMKYNMRYKGQQVDDGFRDAARELEHKERRRMVEWMHVKMH